MTHRVPPLPPSSPTPPREYRVEIFSPPFVLGADYAVVHPAILDAPAELHYGAAASIRYSLLDAHANVTSVVLVVRRGGKDTWGERG